MGLATVAKSASEGFKPTDEQLQALTLFAEGDNLAIEAGAGTGKTSTLKYLAGRTKEKGQYIAFNKAIVEEAKAKMPSNIRANTAHSLAYGNIINGAYKARLHGSSRIKSMDAARFLGISGTTVKVGDSTKKLSMSYLASLALSGVRNFCTSADERPSARHVPYIDGIDLPVNGKRTYTNNNIIAAKLEPYMQKAWADIQAEQGFLRFEHSHYLKMWQLRDPIINADFILFDEAQDANPVMLDIVKQQADRCQLVFVGDSQQQIYTFTGAVNALANVPADHRSFLTQSFRFGPEIAEIANIMLEWNRAELRLQGFDQIESEVGPIAGVPDVYLTRTNAKCIEQTIAYQAGGHQVYIMGGGKEMLSFAKAAQELMEGRKTIHPELCCFDDWFEVQEYVNSDDQGSDLRLNVNLIEKYGVQTIIEALSNTVSEKKADVTVSTAHKAKGCEWDSVKLGTDFPEQEKLNDEEIRLLYVAATRAQKKLDISGVPYIYSPTKEEEDG